MKAKTMHEVLKKINNCVVLLIECDACGFDLGVSYSRSRARFQCT